MFCVVKEKEERRETRSTVGWQVWFCTFLMQGSRLRFQLRWGVLSNCLGVTCVVPQSVTPWELHIWGQRQLMPYGKKHNSCRLSSLVAGNFFNCTSWFCQNFVSFECWEITSTQQSQSGRHGCLKKKTTTCKRLKDFLTVATFGDFFGEKQCLKETDFTTRRQFWHRQP